MSEKVLQLTEEVITGQIKELVCDSVEETLIEIYLAGVSRCRAENIMKALWVSKVSLPSAS